MHVSDIDVNQEFERLGKAFAGFEALRARGQEVCRARAPEVSGWSVEQHLYHVALATDLAFKHVTALVRGKGRLIQEEGAIGERASAVLASDRTPRGEAQAPRMVTPDDEVDPEYLEMELRLNREALERMRELEADIQTAPGWIPHQELGPLAARHWLRFAALHARHHGAIVEEILASCNG